MPRTRDSSNAGTPAGQLDTNPDVQPLASFRDNPAEMIQQLKKTRRPIAFTVDGKPEVVLQDPAEYEHMC